MRKIALIALTSGLLLGLSATPGMSQAKLRYSVTIYNLTSAQIFSPPVVATHTANARIFNAGTPASDALRLLAEDGSPTELVALLTGNAEVMTVVAAAAPIMPGASMTFAVEARGRFDRLSAVGMLVTTNDAFFGLDSLDVDFDLASRGSGATFLVPAYDAGTEDNNENCGFIPGPPCGNGGVRDTLGAEGYVHVHRGIHGIADLDAAAHDWRNPVAKIVVRRMR